MHATTVNTFSPASPVHSSGSLDTSGRRRFPFLGVLCEAPSDDISQRLCRVLSSHTEFTGHAGAPILALGSYLIVAAETTSEDESNGTAWAFAGRLLAPGGMPVEDFLGGVQIDEVEPWLRRGEGAYVGVKVCNKSGTAILFRDRFGLRSLFYHVEFGRLWFTDDLNLMHELFPDLSVRKLGLLEWCHYGSPLAPHSLFDEIFVVPPGGFLTYEPARFCSLPRRYYIPMDSIDPDRYRAQSRKSVGELECELVSHLEAAVRRGMAGEPRVTILLSGGVDSSTLAALAARVGSVQAVTINVEGPDSELRYARRAAEHIGIDLRVCEFDRTRFRSYLVDAVYAQVKPLALENAVAMQYAAAEGYLEPGLPVLDGEGADALFCGSTQVFKFSMSRLLMRRAWRIPCRLVDAVFARIRSKLGYLGLATRSSTDMGGVDLMLGIRGLEVADLTDRIDAAFAHIKDPAARQISVLTMREFYDYLVPLMERIEALGRMCGSQLVLPFLDEEVLNFVVNLPIEAKIRWHWRRGRPLTKWLLKRVAAKLLPPDLMYRPKGGFGIPGGDWVGPIPQRWLERPWISEAFAVRPEAVRSWFARNPTSRDRVFMATIEMWGRLFGLNESFETVQSEWVEAADK